MRKIALLIAVFTLLFTAVKAQLEDINPEYLKTLQGRTGKIVEGLSIDDSSKAARVQEIIVIQYYELSKIHDARDAKLEAIKDLKEEEKETKKQNIINEADAGFYKLHAAYLAKLSAELSQDEVEKVKDGMTYGVVERTYKGYLALLPDISDDQKRYIYKNLVEAREFAMDAGTSKAKHACFGKYKGRINNYLSKAGIDMKKAEEDLKARQEAEGSK